MKNTSILQCPYQELELIDEIKDFMKEHKLNTLEELLVYSAPQLLEMNGFGQRCLFSLYDLLKKNNCEKMLKTRS